jgi:L-arabinokinase
VCGASENQELPPNFVKLAKDIYTPDLIAASDCMLGMMHNNGSLCSLFLQLYGRYNIIFACVLPILGKIGYGTVSEALAYKLPFVFVRRDYFNEEPFLRNMLEVLIFLPS